MRAAIRMSSPRGREGATNNADKGGQEEGEGLAESGDPFQCGLCKREENI